MILQRAIPAAMLSIVIQSFFNQFEKWYALKGLRTQGLP